jgi:phosphoenolpyruvate carboxykinase (ATP)
MNQAGPFNPAFGVESFGLKDLKSISYNLQAPRLVEDAIRRGEALVAKGAPFRRDGSSYRALAKPQVHRA